MATDLSKVINYQDPEFQKKYSKGVSIYNPKEDQRYFYDPNTKTLNPYSPDAKGHDPYIDQGIQQIEFGTGGLQTGESGTTKDFYKFINPESDVYKAAAYENFGLGHTQTPEEAANNARVKGIMQSQPGATLNVNPSANAQSVSMSATGGQVSPETAKYFGMTGAQIEAERAAGQATAPDENLYIGETNWNKLLAQYGPEALNAATMTVNGKKYWDPNKRISDVGGNVPPPSAEMGAITGDVLMDTTEIDTSGIEKGKYTTVTPGETIESSAGTSQAIQQYMNMLTPPETEASKKESDLTSRIDELLGETAGQTDMLNKELDKLGIDKLKSNLNSINNEIQIKTAAYNKRLAELGTTPMTAARLSGAEAAANRVYQADIMFLQASASAAMNDITFAQKQAQAAVNAKYNPILEELNIKSQQLALLEGTLDKEESRYANALNLYLQDRQTAINEAKANETAVNSVVMEIIAANPSIANDRIIDQIKNAKTAVEAMQIASPLLGGGYMYVNTPAELTKLTNAGYEIVDIGGRKFARPGEVAATAKSSGGGGGGGNTFVPSSSNTPSVSNVPATFEEYLQGLVEGQPVK